MMIRSFLPVGQGAFYSESFYVNEAKVNVIYDCGSLTEESIVESKIREVFHEDETIHAVFISHFDKDHINGLPFLFKYCNVKNLFIPLITTKELIMLKLKNLIQEDRLVVKFLSNPRSFFSEDKHTDLYSIRPHSEDNTGESNYWDASIIQSGSDVSDIIFKDYSPNSENPIWEYIPFNFKREDKILKFEDALIHEFPTMASLSEVFEWKVFLDSLLNQYEEYKDKLISAFKKVGGTFNTNSMVLFSGKRDTSIRQSVYQFNCPFHGWYYCMGCYRRYGSCHDSYVNGCLFMGDYDASGSLRWNELSSAYKDYWNYIGCIQIPHHGSFHNYNTEFSHIKSCKVISAGKKNSYNHPHPGVIKDLILKKNQVFIVTEERESEIDLVCDY